MTTSVLLALCRSTPITTLLTCLPLLVDVTAGRAELLLAKHTPLEPLPANDTRRGRHPVNEPHPKAGSRLSSHPAEHLTHSLAGPRAGVSEQVAGYCASPQGA